MIPAAVYAVGDIVALNYLDEDGNSMGGVPVREASGLWSRQAFKVPDGTHAMLVAGPVVSELRDARLDVKISVTKWFVLVEGRTGWVDNDCVFCAVGPETGRDHP